MMLNTQLKEDFLNRLLFEGVSEGTISNYRTKLKHAEITEEELGKNLYEFNPEECKRLIHSYNNSSEGSVAVVLSILINYMNYCIERGYAPVPTNYFEDNKNRMGDFVDKNYEKFHYINKEQLRNIQKELVNDIDKLIFELAFIGITGEQLSDLINLKNENVFEDKIVMDNGREIPIDGKLYYLIQKVIQEDVYENNNGQPYPNNMITVEKPMIPSEYVLRPVDKNKFTLPTLRSRFDTLKQFANCKSLTLTSLSDSGLICYLREVKKQKGELQNSDWLDACIKFDKKPNLVAQTKKKFQHLI